MKMKELSYEDRPYEKLEAYGANALSESELLAIILRAGTKNKPVLEIAQELLLKDAKKEGIVFLLHFPLEELKKIQGIGRIKAIQLKALAELVNRHEFKKPLLGEKIKTPEQLSRLVMAELRNQKQEFVKTIILDTQNRVIKIITNSVGTLNSNAIEIREILNEPIKVSAAKIALIHNHPSGDVTPSQSDIHFTIRVNEACKLFGIDLIDHIIIRKWRFFKFKKIRNFLK